MDEQKLELLLLGPVHISIAGRPVTGLVSLKAKALLAYLAVERCAIARSDLAGLLWSDFPEEAARRNLRVEISKLRQDLDRYLVFTRQEARLKPDAHFQIDVHEFEDNLAALHKNRPLPDLKRLAQAAVVAQRRIHRAAQVGIDADAIEVPLLHFLHVLAEIGGGRRIQAPFDELLFRANSGAHA